MDHPYITSESAFPTPEELGRRTHALLVQERLLRIARQAVVIDTVLNFDLSEESRARLGRSLGAVFDREIERPWRALRREVLMPPLEGDSEEGDDQDAQETEEQGEGSESDLGGEASHA